MEQHNEGTEAIRQLLQAVREQTAKQLPAPEIIAHAVEEKQRLKAGLKNKERSSATYRKKTTDYVTKSKTCKSTRKKLTGNCAGSVMNKDFRKNTCEYRIIVDFVHRNRNLTQKR